MPPSWGVSDSVFTEPITTTATIATPSTIKITRRQGNRSNAESRTSATLALGCPVVTGSVPSRYGTATAGADAPAVVTRADRGCFHYRTSSSDLVSLKAALSPVPPSTGHAGALNTPMVTSVAQSPSGVHVIVPVSPW